ncbi:MAG: murein biosynthesis integral membrane protein MurJ [Deltaproteobacteria bacterium]|jgi:putative peptidoglycan lipid II flippase|nr:murein biosynthesis integral membrane protein MurJ [Deltaproteobacteria bacterium]
MSNQILKGTLTVSILTMLSRILGFFRDLLTAYLFGATYLADAFFVAFKIPNLLRSFVAEGALTNAFVPVFVDELSKSQAQAKETMRSVVSFLLLLTLTLSILGIIFSQEIILVIAPGFSENPAKEQLCILLTQIMLPYIICVSLVVMLNGALNSIGIFGCSAWAQIWMNICLILGALLACFFNSETAIFILAFSVIVGGVVQVAIQVPILRKVGFSILPSKQIFTKVTKQIMFLMLPAILGAAVYQLQILINTLLASVLQSGSVSWLFYADRVVQLPIGVFTVALSSVLLPTLAKAEAEKQKQDFSSNLMNSLRYVSFIIIPISGVLYIFAEPLTWLLFERGQFDHLSSLETARAVQNYSLGIWSVSLFSILIRVFFAKKDTLTPTLIGVVTLVFTVLFSLIFMGDPVSGVGLWMFDLVKSCREFLVPDFGEIISPNCLDCASFVRLSDGSTKAITPFNQTMTLFTPLFNLKHAGLALASSTAMLCSLLIAVFLVAKRNNLNWSPFILATLKSVVSMLLAISVLCLSENYLLDINENFLNLKVNLFKICFEIPLFLSLLFFFLCVFKTRELRETFKLLSNLSRHVK